MPSDRHAAGAPPLPGSHERIQRRKNRAALVSVASNSFLVAAKLLVGFLIGSVSVISEAIHSGVDLVAAAIALYSVRTSSKPADAGHPFGHGKIENISGTIEALLIFAAAGWIIYEAAGKFIRPEPLDAPLLGAAVMLVSCLTNIFVSRMLFRVGRETDSVALVADAWHLRTDVWTSFGVMAGLGIIWIGQRLLPGVDLSWIDPVCAIGVAVLIIKAAYDLTRQAARDLMDASLPPAEEAHIRQSVEAERRIVNGYHALRTRKAGHFRFIEFHIQVDPLMSVADSHALTQKLCRAIRARIPNATITIHVEPCAGECSPVCREGCLVPEEEKPHTGEPR
ncbi:MAG: cation diffusion facilitator family transporter [Desulfobacterales bacterium]|nr:cation diffusion facilitator family transporter [Desulfobacterales bacterium]